MEILEDTIPKAAFHPLHLLHHHHPLPQGVKIPLKMAEITEEKMTAER